jgi:hypothetical protein
MTGRGANIQLGKLVRLLSSNKDGEVLAAAHAIKRTLATRGLDFHNLAAAVETGLRMPLPIPEPQPRRSTSRSSPRRPGGNLQMGDRVLCDEIAGPFRRCKCGSSIFEVMPGIGPHAAQLRCDNCRLGGRWLSRTYFGGRT